MITTGARTQTPELYAAYRQWRNEAASRGSRKPAFGRRLTGLGFAKHHNERGRVYQRTGLTGGSTDLAAGSS